MEDAPRLIKPADKEAKTNVTPNLTPSKIGTTVATLVALTVFLSIIGGISVENMITGAILTVSFFFFLLGGVFGLKLKQYKEAYRYTLIALITYATIDLLEIFL